ncbi:MAG: thioredoxin family protein [Candidatus Aminicenantaceae bacterium]
MKTAILVLLISILMMPFFILGETELVGQLNKEAILQSFPEWQEVAASYDPNPEIIEKLHAITEEIKIEIVLGTWCPDSKEHVSAFFKVMELVDNPLISTIYIGIPRNKEARQQYIQGKNIMKVPTFIVYFHNEEKGRIIETPTNSVEKDLLDIIIR